ncbi:hypothetical protein [Paracoccus cavernae]
MALRIFATMAVLLAGAGSAFAQGAPAPTPTPAEGAPAAAPVGGDTDKIQSLTTVHFELPLSDGVMPEGGDGTDETNYTCLACHSADHLLYQPEVHEAQWREVVDKMGWADHARIDEADAPKIVEYLTNLRGLK